MDELTRQQLELAMQAGLEALDDFEMGLDEKLALFNLECDCEKMRRDHQMENGLLRVVNG